MDEKDRLSDALKKAQQEREQNSKKADAFYTKYIPPVIPRRMEAQKSGIDCRLVSYANPKSTVAEQYRTTVTHILALSNISNLKVIMVTSSSLQEGKTITALNLAIIMACEVGKKVLVIDGNFRNPAVDSYLNIPADKGLSDLLADKADLNEVIFESGISNLFCICAGSTEINAVELLNSAKTENVLTKLKPQFDYIIIDTPAVIPYAEPRIIGKMSDGVILVVKAERTCREVVSRSQALLREVGAKLLGVVLTNIQYHIPEYIHKHL